MDSTAGFRETSGETGPRGGSRGRGRGGQGGGRTRGGNTIRRGNDGARGGASARTRGASRGSVRGRNAGNQDGSHEQGLPHELRHAEVRPQPQLEGNGVFDTRLTKDAGDTQGNKIETDAESGEVEAEVCFICASSVSHNSVAPCNHRTCHICALRMRALYKTKACAHCRTESATVIFTDDAEKHFEDYTEADFYRTDPNLGICYEKAEIFEDTVLLLRYNCPDESCDVACMGWPDLHRHVRSVHQKVMCDLCTRNKKVFTHEHELFTHQELRRHEKYGDDTPGAVDQSGFKGHPECGFCRQRFYGDDELYAHCRDKHERCHLCDRRNEGQSPQYFLNYEALEQHFNKEHHPCLDTECLEKKFVVFDSEIDLKAHQLESHPNGLSKDARRDARRVDISAFDFRPQYLPEPRRGGRRAGRGRDPNAEHMPATATGHMSRAELAHQREREIHGAQSASNRRFGGQLSQPEPQAQTAQRPAQSPRPGVVQPVTDPSPSAGTTSRPTAASTPQEQARMLRHAAVTERAANLLRNDKTKLNEFRERISVYTRDGTSAADLIDAFFSLFDTSSEELGKLVKELADIFEVSGKRDGLLKAWSDWKAINEDYPSLPGPSGANSITAAGVLGQGVGASRVLKLKSSTAQSSRAASGGRQAAALVSSAASSIRPSNAFPSLPARNGGSSKVAAPPAPTPNWLAGRSAGAASSGASSSRPKPAVNMNRPDAFPALPAAKKPTSTVFSPGYTGAGVIRNNSNVVPTSPWGGNAAAENEAASIDDAGNGAGKKRGNKGKKQMLFQWG